MILLLKRLREQRAGVVLLLVVLLISISTFTRILLTIKSFSEVDFTVVNEIGIFLLGLSYDLINAVYFSLPLILYLWLVPDKIYQKSWHKVVLFILLFIFSFLLIFNGVAEWLFWDEFNVRFNFIAVDYLVYTTEVIGNIHQSYPIELILLLVTVASAFIVFLIRSGIRTSSILYMPFKQRSKYVGYYAILFFVILFTVTSKYHHFSKNAYVNELAGNGLYELFAAYRNNELDYEQFYKAIGNEKAFELARQYIKTPEAEFLNSYKFSIVRKIVNPGPETKLNVVLISVESFSADFMKLFGNTENITPFLDSLSDHSLVFTNLYATGTRTVRGLEALSLCVPPTPGQSIVRRPNSEELFSLGKVFGEKGYASKYIYGGYSYFDNMGYFFGHNSYQVVDRSALNDNEIDYENIWGVADENLFDLTIKEIDTSSKEHPVFAHVMTTSNHRPFTYPEGRIDIPSHTSRSGAVKYTDYAIGRFIKQASRKSWFNNTVFVVVADHCASSAGKTELPVNKYHIPMLIYSPGNVQPGVMNRLMSQIDIGPTLLGMLNFSYTSNFFGYDIFKLEPGRERAFISTYQNLGYIKNGKLVILSPQFKVDSFTLLEDQEPINVANDQQIVNEAVAWYQSASYSFKHGL
ncbi:MAG: sulfatase, partial [Flavobacterium psychrophilum]